MARQKTLGVSPITNTIYYGTQDTEKHMWIGEKTDVTEDAVRAVFDWFLNEVKDKELRDNQEFRLRYPNSDFEWVMRRKK